MILAFSRKREQKEASRFVASEESDPTQIGENPPEKICFRGKKRSKTKQREMMRSKIYEVGRKE